MAGYLDARAVVELGLRTSAPGTIAVRVLNRVWCTVVAHPRHLAEDAPGYEVFYLTMDQLSSPGLWELLPSRGLTGDSWRRLCR